MCVSVHACVCIYTYIQVLLGSLTGVRAFYLPGKTHTLCFFVCIFFLYARTQTLPHITHAHMHREGGGWSEGGVMRSKPGDVVNSVGV